MPHGVTVMSHGPGAPPAGDAHGGHLLIPAQSGSSKHSFVFSVHTLNGGIAIQVQPLHGGPVVDEDEQSGDVVLEVADDEDDDVDDVQSMSGSLGD